MDDETNGNVCQQSKEEGAVVEEEEERVFKLPSTLPIISKAATATTTKSNEIPVVLKPSAAVAPNDIKEELIPYKEPAWSGIPTQPYSFEVLKGGIVVGTIDLTERPYTVCGRLPGCHIVMEHPSISRYHAVIQYRSIAATEDGEGQNSNRPSGFYVYDLGSTHGTFLNKNHQLKPKCYYPIHVGHMIKFGGSSRVYLLQGPDDDQEEESPLTVTQLKELGKSRQAAEILKKVNGLEGKNEEQETEEDTGINWGMGEDAVEDETPDMAVNPFALDGHALDDSSYASDPKKTLRGWFEREGYDLKYEVDEIGQANFLCRIRLPLDDVSGGPLWVEASVKGKKKEAVAACALEACKTLDRRGVLRTATHESRQRKKRNWEEDDYYNSDEDTFLDRTGTVERKRKQRIQRAGKEKDCIDTYETLMEKHAQLKEKIAQMEDVLSRRCVRANETDEEQDALDAYMKSIASGDDQIDKKEKSRLKVELRLLREESEKLRRLIEIARPTTLPPMHVEAPNTKDTVQPKQYGLIKSSRDNFKIPIAREPSVTKETIQQPDETINKSETIKDSVSDISELPKKVITCERHSVPETQESCVEERLSPNRSGIDESTVVKEDSDIRNAEVDAPKRQKGNRKHKEKVTKYDYDKSNPNYAMWLPPDDQSGDGKTNLNEKYGY